RYVQLWDSWQFPRGHTYWGEQMSGVPNSHNYSLSRKGTFQLPSLTDSPMEEEDSAVLAMFHAVANSHLAVQSQQKDEPDFTAVQKLDILRNLYHTKPLIFLERFRTVLREEDLPCFRHLSGNYEADFYCAEVRKANLGKTLHTRVKNKRYATPLSPFLAGGEYFSDEQMRGRDPLLYEQYIGQYLSDEELQELGHCKLEASCSLSGILLDSYQEKVIQQRLLIQQEQEEACQEEEEEDSDQDSKDEWVPDEEEKAFLREEFTSRMYQRFLEGKDLDFNYSEVDENPDFDNLDIVSRDEEERYFDGEEPETADRMETEEAERRA
uniref:Coiled-coil domain containing 97 n=1 Tax=Naja naja TaxID=35670 RepID=A0A8C6Y323_NAJNA